MSTATGGPPLPARVVNSVRSGPLAAYWHRPGVLHRVPAVWKLPIALLFIVGVVLVPRHAWGLYAAGGMGFLLLAWLSGVPVGHLLGRLVLVAPLAVGMALLSWFQPGGTEVFLGTLAKSVLCLATMVLLMATTRFSDLLAVLVRWRVPRLLVTTLSLTYRYLFLLSSETSRLLRARRSRTFVSGRWPAWRGLATVAAQLFIRTSERAERVHAAMCARGWW